jgi:hypothetical protein
MSTCVQEILLQAPNTVFLMNMISSQQQQAWSLISKQIQTPAILITSGILEENESDYLAWRNSQSSQACEKTAGAASSSI